jgi:hypothetical protein
VTALAFLRTEGWERRKSHVRFAGCEEADGRGLRGLPSPRGGFVEPLGFTQPTTIAQLLCGLRLRTIRSR